MIGFCLHELVLHSNFEGWVALISSVYLLWELRLRESYCICLSSYNYVLISLYHMLCSRIWSKWKWNEIPFLDKLFCNSNPCKNAGQCVEVPGNFKCLCGQGFSGNTCDGNENLLLRKLIFDMPFVFPLLLRMILLLDIC